jgi:hypothetical protein
VAVLARKSQHLQLVLEQTRRQGCVLQRAGVAAVVFKVFHRDGHITGTVADPRRQQLVEEHHPEVSQFAVAEKFSPYGVDNPYGALRGIHNYNN